MSNRLTRCTRAWSRSSPEVRRTTPSIPLLFQPGAEWNYSVATDVLGRVVEVASGQRLDEFLDARVFGPLAMTDTGFYAPPDQLSRLAALYTRGADGKAARLDSLGESARRPPDMLSGGGGLVSTAADYHRFTQLLLHRADSPAGELDGVRLLSPRTVSYMGRNHLPGDAHRFPPGLPANRIFERFFYTDKAPRQCPFALKRFQITANEQNLEILVVQTEDNRVHRQGRSGIFVGADMLCSLVSIRLTPFVYK